MAKASAISPTARRFSPLNPPKRRWRYSPATSGRRETHSAIQSPRRSAKRTAKMRVSIVAQRRCLPPTCSMINRPAWPGSDLDPYAKITIDQRPNTGARSSPWLRTSPITSIARNLSVTTTRTARMPKIPSWPLLPPLLVTSPTAPERIVSKDSPRASSSCARVARIKTTTSTTPRISDSK